MDQTQPQLGYGKPSEASIDQVNIYMRSAPWYQEQMRAWGQDPGHPTLSKSQSQQILRLAQQNGVVVDEGNMEVDDHGNFNPKGHKLRNTLVVAGIAAATIATMGAAGVFAGAAGAGAGAGGAGATGAGLAGAEMGMSAALPGALASVPALSAGTAAGLAGAGAAGYAGTAAGEFGLTSTPAITGGMAANTAAGAASGLGATSAATGATGGTGIVSKALKGVSTLSKAGDLLGAAGTAIGDANTAAGQNRLDERNSALTANGQNIQGQSAFEQQLMNRELAEERQRKDALKNVYRASFTANTPRSPFNPTGPARYSDSYLSTLKNLDSQGAGTLSSVPTYATNSMPALRPYTPIDIKDVPGATGTQKGTLSKIGDWVGPAASTIGTIARLYSKR